MQCYIKKYISDPFGDYLYFIFRIMVALLFFQHGLQKLFGFFGGIDGKGGTVELFSLLGLAGMIELIGPIAIIAGIFTRPAALLMAVEMLVAYSKVHFPRGVIPLMNKGELVLLYFAAFLVLVVYGAGKWGFDKRIFKNEQS